MITVEKWRHGQMSFGISISPGLLNIHGFGWSWELEWGSKDKGAAWVRRQAMRKLG